MSGLFPWVRRFNACLCAAIAAHTAHIGAGQEFSAKKRPARLFFILRVSQALAWIRMLLHGQARHAFDGTVKVEKWMPVATRS